MVGNFKVFFVNEKSNFLTSENIRKHLNGKFDTNQKLQVKSKFPKCQRASLGSRNRVEKMFFGIFCFSPFFKMGSCGRAPARPSRL